MPIIRTCAELITRAYHYAFMESCFVRVATQQLSIDKSLPTAHSEGLKTSAPHNKSSGSCGRANMRALIENNSLVFKREGLKSFSVFYEWLCFGRCGWNYDSVLFHSRKNLSIQCGIFFSEGIDHSKKATHSFLEVGFHYDSNTWTMSS